MNKETKELIETLAKGLTQEDIIRCEERAEGYIEGLKDGVESSRPTWIPCSERLPSEDEEVLVCDKDGTMEVCDLETFGRGVGLKWTDKNGYECWLDVIAWMPLPKPYEECKESE